MIKPHLLISLLLPVLMVYGQEKKAKLDTLSLNTSQVTSNDTTKLPVKNWKNRFSIGINISQAAFTDNWRGGGVNSLAIGGHLNYKLDHTKADKNFVSELITQYGKLKNRDQLERKTNDRIFWDNKLSLKLSKNWSFFSSINFESQFDDGYNFTKNQAGEEVKTLISQFMAPGYITESFGVEYKPNKTYWMRIGTGTARQTFVLNRELYLTNLKNYGVDHGENFRNELAFQLVGNFEKEVFKNINLKSRYALFANYEKLRSIDHRLDLLFTARVNRFINVAITGVGIYDDDTSADIQASQALSLGVTYKYPR